MILQYLSASWATLAPALGNHLWQSTLFAGVAGLLTLALRKNQARFRYWLWMAASLKFLIPFFVLIAIGNYLSWSRGSGPAQAVYVVMVQVTAPFTQPMISPTLLGMVWLCGFVTVISTWCLRWRRVSATLRQATPLPEGREVEALRRMESSAGMAKRIGMYLSNTSLEPGIFGIVRPVLLWPEGISAHLDDVHLETILAHELRHVRRRDNLAALIHMLVEAIFWFHPLVWWLGARLMEERELACDEEVLQAGSDRHVYAESILKVCEFCVGSPLACVSGITGSDLKRRMVHIMTNHVSRKLDFSRKLLLSTAGVLVLALPILFGFINATPSQAQSQENSAGAPRPNPKQVRVSEEVMSALILNKVPPKYPDTARRDHVTGIVILNTTINRHGDVRDIHIASGDPTLASSAVDAVKQWKYKPYVLNGEPIEVKTQVHVTYTLAPE